MTSAMASDARTNAALFGLLSETFTYPSPGLVLRIATGDWAGEVSTLVPAGVAIPPVPADSSMRTLSMQYMSTFELPAGSACPLYTGIYARQRKEAMEELLRFYRHFGLTLSEDPRDLPDSVPTVLEFLQFLSWREAREQDDGMNVLQAAQRDVIQRHLLPWARSTAERLQDRAEQFYPQAVVLLGEVCEERLA